jgi:hypothetical protein
MTKKLTDWELHLQYQQTTLEMIDRYLELEKSGHYATSYEVWREIHQRLHREDFPQIIGTVSALDITMKTNCDDESERETIPCPPPLDPVENGLPKWEGAVRHTFLGDDTPTLIPPPIKESV